MSRRTHCQICKLEFGTKVKPSDLCEIPELRAADVAQVCVECEQNLPDVILYDLRERPKFFADNAIKKRRYQYKKHSMEKVGFDDHRLIINTNVPGVIGNA